MAQLNSLVVTGDSRFLNTINGNITTANGIHRATMDSSSTATAFVLTADDIDSLYDGLIITCKNTKIASASGCTINLNGLGAKSIWLAQSNSACTTHWNVNETYMFVYDSTNSRWELQQGRDTNSDTYDRNRYNCNIKCGTTAIVAGNIIVADSNGLYKHLKLGTAFDIRYPILYANGAISASSTGTNNYDILHITITTTQSISMTAYTPVYIKGTLSGTTFTPVSTTPLTQTVPTSADGYYYIKLGVATATTAMYLQEVHPIYAYRGNSFVEVVTNISNIPFIIGTGSTAGTWLGELDGLTAYYDGLTILYKPSVAGASTTTLNLNSLGAKTCYANNTSKLTTHFPVNQPILLVYSASQNSGCWISVNNYWDDNDTAQLYGYYAHPTAGGNGLKQYSLFARLADGTYSSFTTNNGTGTKTFDTTSLFDMRKIYYLNNSSNVASGSVIGNNQLGEQINLVDARYTFNGITTSSGFTANKPVYLTITLQPNGFFKLTTLSPYTSCWTHTPTLTNTPSDGYLYFLLLGFAYDTYRFNLLNDNPIYKLLNNKLIPFYGYNTSGANSSLSEDLGHLATSEGYLTIAVGNYSHTEGQYTTANGDCSHTEGMYAYALNNYSHAEGSFTYAGGEASHVENCGAIAMGNYSHAEGYYTYTIGEGSHAEGSGSYPVGSYSHAEGSSTYATGGSSHAEGINTSAVGYGSHTEGFRSYTSSTAYGAHAEGGYYKTSSDSCTGGYALGSASHAEGGITSSVGNYSHAEGSGTCANGIASHAEGQNTTANKYGSHAEGYYTYAVANYSHVEGQNTTASGASSHAEGSNTSASGSYSHAEGYLTTANGNYGAHTEGYRAYAAGEASHAEGHYTCAIGDISHAEGFYTCASGNYQHVEGKYNVADSNMAHIIGGGTNASNRKNIFTVDWDGNVTANSYTGSGSIPFVVGTGDTAGTWLGSLNGLTAYYDGLAILYKPSVAGASTTTLNLNSLGAKTCYANNTSKLTTHFPVNQPILLVYSASQNSGCWISCNNYWDGNDTATVHSYYSRGMAGANGIKQYSLFARVLDGANTSYSSFTTNNGTGTKTFDTTHYFDIRKIYYSNNKNNIASGSTLGDNQMSQQENTVDGRYTFNSITTSAGFTANKPVYIVFDKASPSYNCYKIKSPYWTHTPNDTNALYVLVGFSRSTYQISLMMDNQIFEYKDSILVPFKVGGGEGQITNVLPITETDYNALQDKDNSTIYNVMKDNKALTLFSSQGDRRIINTSKDVSNYEFWYENLIFAPNTTSENTKVDPTIYTDIKLFSSANINRDWKLEFKVTPDSYGGGSENAIIGTTGTDGNLRYEIYASKSNAPNFPLHLYGRFGNDTNVGNVAGKDVVITKSDRTLTVTADGTQITSTTLSTTTTESNDYKMNIGNFRKYHTFCGIVHYIGFVWLS